MIRVTLKPLWSNITFDDQDELDWLIVQGSVKSQFNPMTGSYGQIEYLFTDLRDGRPTSYPSADLDIPKAILTGAVPLVVAEAKDHGLQVVVDDAKWKAFAPKYTPAYDQLPVTLHAHQTAACDVAGQKKFGIIKAPTGCHRKGQLILMANGSTKKIEDVVVGDRVQGLDAPRTVLALARGHDTMARIQPVKGDPWEVNLDHVLTLMHTETGVLKDISVRGWLTWSKSQKHLWKLFRQQVFSFEGATADPLPVDPYFLGVILGDGSLSGGSVKVCKDDQEIHNCCKQQAEAWGLRYIETRPENRARFCTLAKPEGYARNPLISALRDLGVWGTTAENKFVPQVYLSASWDERRQLLAGLLDTDGHMTRAGFDWISKSSDLANAVVFLARSLGLAAYGRATYKECQTGAGGIYWRVSINGDCDLIPTRVPRKQAPPRQQIKDVRRTGFSVTLLPPDDYYGFQLDGDQRYLLGDFTVTHNSGKTYVGIAISLGLHGTSTLVLVPGPGLLKAYVKGFAESGETAGQLGDETRLVVTTYDRVASWLKKQPGPAQAYLARFRAVIGDECHVCVSDGRLPVMRALINAQVRIGLSATPFDRSDKRDPLVAGVLGPRIYAIETDELVERGHIAKADITMVAFAHEVSGSVEAMLRMKWATRYARHVVRNKERNRALLSLVERAAKPALLFVKELEHVYEMERLIAGARLNVRSVTGAMGVRQREGLIDDIRRGRVDVVVCTKVWSTGIDIPELASVIVGGAGKAAIDVVQTIGRGMRIADGKNTFEVWDLHDTVYTALHKQGQGRVRVYRGEGHQVNLLGDFDHKRGDDERDEYDTGDDGADDAA